MPESKPVSRHYHGQQIGLGNDAARRGNTRMILVCRTKRGYCPPIAPLMRLQILREKQRIAACESSLLAQGARRIWRESLLPTPGCPFSVFRFNRSFNGLDSLLSTAQMPGGIPVGTLAIGEAGAKNAALLAAAILATSDKTIRQKFEAFRNKAIGAKPCRASVSRAKFRNALQLIR